MLRRGLFGLFVLSLAACSGAPLTLDAGPTAADDAGAAAPSPDGGARSDAGAATDASAPPRADVPAVPCGDTLDHVYVTPALPPMTTAARGDLVRCALDGPTTLAEVKAQVADKGLTTPMTTGVTIYRVAFRTERGDGSPGVSTARVYLPVAPATLPLPVIVVGHPTDGIADGCAPSMDATSNRELALPWAGLGYAVIVPDYAGLGNEGVQGYLDNRDQAHSILDGARALRKLLAPGALSDEVLAVGYSQGGGAVLSAQAIASSYGAGDDLVGVIAFAPEWPTRLNSFDYLDMLRNPDELTIQTGISDNVVAVMRTFGYFFNHAGAGHADDGFPAPARAGFDSAVTSLCQAPLGGWLQGNALHVKDFVDDELRTSLLACVDGGDQAAGCVEPGKSYHAYLESNLVTADPKGAKVLYVQGLSDYIMPAASEAACNVQKLLADGVTPQVCVDAAAQHQTVVDRNADFAIRWGLALLDGQPLPACSDLGMPPCLP